MRFPYRLFFARLERHPYPTVQTKPAWPSVPAGPIASTYTRAASCPTRRDSRLPANIALRGAFRAPHFRSSTRFQARPPPDMAATNAASIRASRRWSARPTAASRRRTRNVSKAPCHAPGQSRSPTRRHRKIRASSAEAVQYGQRASSGAFFLPAKCHEPSGQVSTRTAAACSRRGLEQAGHELRADR